MATARAALAGALTTTLPNDSSPALPVQTSSLTAATVSTPAGSSTTTLALPAPTPSAPPPLTAQIANLLNLAQYMLNNVREQQVQQHDETEVQQRRRQTRKGQRNFRRQAYTPYQRPSIETQGLNDGANNATNTSNSANGLEWRVGGGNSEADGRSVITNVALEQLIMSGRGHKDNNNSHYNNRHSSTNREDNTHFRCSICLDSYLLHRPMVTQCGHLFCKRCIRKCVRGVGKCPMCNCKLNSNSVFRVYF
ncbi:myb-like protein A [Ceratitis capitata]|uniref:myb-like protein A n=1 Tax=Ceratitis capitata TaxID=7213 RepID=UPI0006188770|nr:myb-like protein A [Ceratitis capitata]